MTRPIHHYILLVIFTIAYIALHAIVSEPHEPVSEPVSKHIGEPMPYEYEPISEPYELYEYEPISEPYELYEYEPIIEFIDCKKGDKQCEKNNRLLAGEPVTITN